MPVEAAAPSAPALSARRFVHELPGRSRTLYVLGVAMLLLFGALAMAAAVDGTQVTGLNRWVKPMKFALSTAIYAWTIAWLLPDARIGRRLRAFIAWGTVTVFLVEIPVIVVQAARGVRSHFNRSTLLDGSLYAVMGLFILFNTLLAFLLLVAFLRRSPLPRAYLWAIRLGLVLFLLGSAEGGYMSAGQGHSVGVPDGGAGVPFVNWSTEGGDLRVAHFLGLHALQWLPLLGWWLSERRVRSGVAVVWGAALAYGVLACVAFGRALAGRPLPGV